MATMVVVIVIMPVIDFFGWKTMKSRDFYPK